MSSSKSISTRARITAVGAVPLHLAKSPGARLFGVADCVWPFRSRYFGHSISVHTELITFVYLNDYIGRRNVTLAGVTPTPFDVAAK